MIRQKTHQTIHIRIIFILIQEQGINDLMISIIPSNFLKKKSRNIRLHTYMHIKLTRIKIRIPLKQRFFLLEGHRLVATQVITNVPSTDIDITA